MSVSTEYGRIYYYILLFAVPPRRALVSLRHVVHVSPGLLVVAPGSSQVLTTGPVLPLILSSRVASPRHLKDFAISRWDKLYLAARAVRGP